MCVELQNVPFSRPTHLGKGSATHPHCIPRLWRIYPIGFVPEERRDDGIIEKGMAKIPELLTVLNDTLEGRSYLVGDDFTLADLNVASIVSLCSEIKFDLTAYKNIQTWFTQIPE